MRKICCFCIALLFILTSCQSTSSIIPESKTETETTTLTWYINFSWFNKSWGEDATSKYITEQTGINVEYITPTGDESEKLTSMISSGMMPDIVTLGFWDELYYTMIDKDVLAALNVLDQQYDTDFFEYANNDTINWYSDDSGNIYAYPNSSYSIEDFQSSSNQTFLVREDIYIAIGSPDMSTPEGFLQALSDAKEMFPTVDGKDLIPLGLQEFTSTGNSSIEEYLQNFLAVPYEVDGQVYDRFTDEQYITWLKTLNEANQMGLLATDVFVDKRVQMEEKIAQGRYFAMLYQWSDCSEQLQLINQTNPEQNYIAIDGPKNSNQDDHTLSGSGIQGWTLTGISNTSKNQEEAIKLLSFLMSDQGQKLIFLGVEGDSYEIVENEIVFYDEVIATYNSDRSTYDKIYGGASTHWPMMNNSYAYTMGYNMPNEDNIQSIIDWTSKYATNLSLYLYENYSDNPQVNLAYNLDTYAKAELLPKLLFAQSEEEFDMLFNEYLSLREENNYYLVMEENQKILEENKARLFN
ncbi:MAG: extracellular solute-binding protein [Clostridia bacterium]